MTWKVFSLKSFLVFLAAVTLILIFAPAYFGTIAKVIFYGACAVMLFLLLAARGYLPGFLKPLADRFADKRPIAQDAPSPAPHHPRHPTGPIVQPRRSTEAIEFEEWEPKTFKRDLLSRYIGSPVINEISEELTSYLDSKQTQPLICIFTAPESAGKTALCSALSYALGRQFTGTPEPISRGASLAVIDDDFSHRDDIAFALVDSIDQATLQESEIKLFELRVEALVSKVVFLFIRAKSRGDIPHSLTGIAHTTLELENASLSKLSRLKFKRLFDEQHAIEIEVDDTEEQNLSRLIIKYVSAEANTKEFDFPFSMISTALRPVVAEIVERHDLQPNHSYILTTAPSLPKTGPIPWPEIVFEEVERNE